MPASSDHFIGYQNRSLEVIVIVFILFWILQLPLPRENHVFVDCSYAPQLHYRRHENNTPLCCDQTERERV